MESSTYLFVLSLRRRCPQQPHVPPRFRRALGGATPSTVYPLFLLARCHPLAPRSIASHPVPPLWRPAYRQPAARAATKAPRCLDRRIAAHDRRPWNLLSVRMRGAPRYKPTRQRDSPAKMTTNGGAASRGRQTVHPTRLSVRMRGGGWARVPVRWAMDKVDGQFSLLYQFQIYIPFCTFFLKKYTAAIPIRLDFFSYFGHLKKIIEKWI
jgi:hypothetical protein